MAGFSRSDLADLNVFLTIARRGSFRQAATELGLTASALSHTMKKLEERLEVRLLNRTSRSVSLTPAGTDLAEALSQGLETISNGLSALDGYRKHAVGRLRLNVPHDAARLLVSPVLREFFEAFPQVHIDLAVEDRLIDVVAEGFEAGIRFGASTPKDMIAVPLTPPLRWVVVASPDYLARHGRPTRPEDLYHHSCVQMRLGDQSAYAWELGDGEAMVRIDCPGSIRVNDSQASLDAALDGIGLAYCLEWRVRDHLASGRLELVMPEWSSMGPPFVMYYPSRRQSPPGLKQLVELIRRHSERVLNAPR